MGSFIVLPKCKLPYWGVVPRSSSFPKPKLPFANVGWLQRSWPGADACICAGQEGLGAAASFLERCLLPERLPCQHCFMGHFLKLTAHSPVQSDYPGAPVGAVARPTRGPAWPNLTMWQAWMAAHSRASSQCCLPRSQMLLLEKITSQFEILVLWSLLREDEEERFKVVVWKCQHLLASISAYYTLSCQGLSSWCFQFCNQVISAQPFQALGVKGRNE